MAKAASKDLFILIKSLSRSEKRYFKLYATRNKGESDNHYVRLFDAIAEQEEYDEAELLRTETYINSLTQLKGRLYEAILNSLQLFHADRSDTMEVRNMLNQVELLYEKGLQEQALKVLQKAYSLAESNEEFTYQLEISATESKIRGMKVDIGWLKEGIRETVDRESALLEKLRNMLMYRQLAAAINLWGYSKNQLRKTDEIEQVDSLDQFQLLTDESSCLSDRSRMTHYHLKAIIHFWKEEHEESIRYFMKLKDFVNADPVRRKKHSTLYFIAITNIINTGDKVLTFEEMVDLIESLKAEVKADPSKETDFLTRYYHSILAKSSSYGRFAEGLEYAREADSWMVQQGKLHKPYGIGICFHLAYIYFLNNDLNRSLFWVNRILQEPEEESLFFYVPVLVFSLIVHYELENIELLEYKVRSVYRYLYKRDKLYKFEATVLAFIRNKLPRVNNNKELVKVFEELRQELALLAEDPYEKKPLFFFDYIAWLDSKISNRPFAEVLFEKVKSLGRI